MHLVHPSHRRLCSHAALPLGTPRPLGLWGPGLLSRSVACAASFRSRPPSRPSLQTHVHGAPSAGHAASPVTTGHPRSGRGSYQGLCGFWASSCLMGAPQGGQHAQGGGRLLEETRGAGVPVQAAPPQVSKPARSRPRRSGQCPPAHCCHHWGSCSFLRLWQLPHTGTPSTQHRGGAVAQGTRGRSRWLAWGSFFLRNRCWS